MRTRTLMTILCALSLSSTIVCGGPSNTGVYSGFVRGGGVNYSALTSVSRSGRILNVTETNPAMMLEDVLMDPVASRVKRNGKFRGNNRLSGADRSSTVGRIRNGKKMVGTTSLEGTTARLTAKKRFK